DVVVETDLPLLHAVRADGVERVVLGAGVDRAVVGERRRRRDVGRGRELPAQRAVGPERVDAVGAEVDRAVGADGRAAVDRAAYALGTGSDLRLARAGAVAPLLLAIAIDGVEKIVVRAEVDGGVDRDRGRGPDPVAGREAPLHLAGAVERVELAVVAPDVDRAVGADGGRSDDRVAELERPDRRRRVDRRRTDEAAE